ncbi:hypothetical protein, partial [uncultured Nostoc sp.]|uniref:hypothetical protein n=1 Tax=uncultured Nostoc sp. TaxID=340711 RepID=UPI0035CABBE3
EDLNVQGMISNQKLSAAVKKKGVGCRGRHWTELGLRPMQSSLTTGLVSQRLLGLFLSLHPTPYTLHPAPTGLGQQQLLLRNSSSVNLQTTLLWNQSRVG